MSAEGKSGAAPLSLRTHGLVLAMLLETSLIDVHSIVDWAVEQIDHPGAPIEELADLASADRAHPLDVVHMLRDLPGALDAELAFALFCGHLLAMLDEDPTSDRSIAKALYVIAGMSNTYTPSNEAYSVAIGLDDVFYLADTGVYGDHESARRDLREFLERYAVDGVGRTIVSGS